MKDLRNELVELFRETDKAYELAAGTDNQEEADWAYWYADFLRNPLSDALEQDLTRTRIVQCLAFVEDESKAKRQKHAPSPEDFADHFIARLGRPNLQTETELSLYYYPECPFCQRVLKAIRETGAEVELRHIWENPEFRKELHEARGRTTVPVLRISGKGSDRWLPESLDIVRYLHERENG